MCVSPKECVMRFERYVGKERKKTRDKRESGEKIRKSKNGTWEAIRFAQLFRKSLLNIGLRNDFKFYGQIHPARLV